MPSLNAFYIPLVCLTAGCPHDIFFDQQASHDVIKSCGLMIGSKSFYVIILQRLKEDVVWRYKSSRGMLKDLVYLQNAF